MAALLVNEETADALVRFFLPHRYPGTWHVSNPLGDEPEPVPLPGLDGNGDAEVRHD